MIPQISPVELAAMLDQAKPPCVVDVREPWELEICSLPGAIAIPLGELPQRLAELPAGQPVVTVCHHGVRSLHAALFLRSTGFGEVLNLAGGLAAWAETVDPAMPRY